MDLRKLKTLIDLVEASDISELELTEGEEKVKISRQNNIQPSVAPVNYVHQPTQVPTYKQPAVKAEEPEVIENITESKNVITSPMVGSFYRAASPDSAPFIDIGSSVKKGDTLCIIEAMKLFNEIESEVSGKIVKVLVDDSSPVEFDQPLFLIDPS